MWVTHVVDGEVPLDWYQEAITSGLTLLFDSIKYCSSAPVITPAVYSWGVVAEIFYPASNILKGWEPLHGVGQGGSVLF